MSDIAESVLHKVITDVCNPTDDNKLPFFPGHFEFTESTLDAMLEKFGEAAYNATVLSGYNKYAELTLQMNAECVTLLSLIKSSVQVDTTDIDDLLAAYDRVWFCFSDVTAYVCLKDFNELGEFKIETSIDYTKEYSVKDIANGRDKKVLLDKLKYSIADAWQINKHFQTAIIMWQKRMLALQQERFMYLWHVYQVICVIQQSSKKLQCVKHTMLYSFWCEHRFDSYNIHEFMHYKHKKRKVEHQLYTASKHSNMNTGLTSFIHSCMYLICDIDIISSTKIA